MSETDPTGYGESAETTDGEVGPGGVQQEGPESVGPESEATLTTDDEAQEDDGVVRPGNLPD